MNDPQGNKYFGFWIFDICYIPSDSPGRGNSKMPKISEIGWAVQKLWPIPWEWYKPRPTFSLYNYIGQKWAKNGQKRPYFAQKWPKWPKILTYDTFIGFLSISKIFKKFANFLPIFGQKTAFFSRPRQKKKKKTLAESLCDSRKMVQLT